LWDSSFAAVLFHKTQIQGKMVTSPFMIRMMGLSGDNLDGAVIFPLICRLAVLILGFVDCVKIVGFVQQQQQQNNTTTTT
jgi:hypothetical protein